MISLDNTTIVSSELYNDHEKLISICNQKRKLLPTSPSQSNFRVFCLLLVQLPSSETIIVEGTNGEQGYIGGAICAERSALLRTCFLISPVIRKVVVTTDSFNALAPGVLCREYLISSTEPSAVVVMGNHDGTVIRESTLCSLYPVPYKYRYWQRKHVLQNAIDYCKNIKRIEDFYDENIVRLHREAMQYVKNDNLDDLHPIRYAAGVMFADGSVSSAWTLKGLEYGCTLDPVTQLIRDMEVYRLSTELEDDSDKSNIVKYLIMIDQFGVCHAPFAQARSLLVEHGFKYVKCVVHTDDGNIEIINAGDLVPQAGENDTLSSRDFH